MSASSLPFLLRRPARLVAAGLIAATPFNLGAQNDPDASSLLLDAARCGDSLFAVGERGAIVRSVDSGHSWERIVIPTGATLTGLSFAPHTQEGWAVGHDATIFCTHDGGLSWLRAYKAADLSQSFLDVLALSSTDVLAVGAFGLAVETRDGGHTWQPVSVDSTDRHLNAICRLNDGTILVVGEAGLVRVSTDLGKTWSSLDTSYEGSFFGATPVGEHGFLLYGLRGHLYACDNWSRPEWRELATPAGSGLLASCVRLRNGAWVVAGQARTFLVSHNQGRSFEPWNSGLTTAVAKLIQAPDGTLLAFGESGVSLLPQP